MAASSDISSPLDSKPQDIAFPNTTEDTNSSEPKTDGEKVQEDSLPAEISRPSTSSDKRLNGVKPPPKGGNLTPETWTVTSDSQIWLECCQNSFRACGGSNVRSSKLSNSSPNHLFSAMQGSSPCPQGHRSATYSRNSQYVVHLHVNPGETISFDMGDHVQLIQGPATVRMVSSNNTPPVPMPVQVPPGHMVQQIVDEHGTLRHIILSPQPPVAVSVGNPYNGSASGTPVSGSAPFYLYHHPSYSIPPQFPPHMQSGLGPQGLHGPVDPLHNGHSSDERTQRQFYKLKKRLESRNKEAAVLPHAANQETSVKTSDSSQNETNPSAHSIETSDKKISEKESLKLEILSSVKAPSICDITATSALLEWEAPELRTEANCDIDASELQYNLLLCDKVLNTKPKVIYSGKETKFLSDDLKPATSYSAQVQAKLNKLSGNLSESSSFKTLCCKPDAPQPPKLQSRTKTSILLKWNAAVDNGAKISSYILEYDEGSGSDNFVEIFNGLQKQYKASKLKTSTCYRFRLAAVNEYGQSEYSGVSCFSTSGSTPSQPSPPLLREAFVNRLHLEWEQRPNDDNYTLQMEDERTLHGFLPMHNGKDTSYTCLRLTHNTSYKFRLCASNDEGSSPWSQVVTYSTLPDKPDKPGKPCLKGRTHSTFFKVAWDPPKEDGGCPVTEYHLEMDSGDGFVSVYRGEELEHLCENLQPGKSYSFRVQCSSLGGTSEFSDLGCAVTLPVVPGKCEPPKMHGKPKALSVHLKWANPEYDGGSDVLGYEVEVINPDETSRIAYKGIVADCVVAGLLPGRKYSFKVRAYNKIGNGPWSDACEVTSGAGVPDPPVVSQAVARSPHCVFVAWEEPSHNGAPISEYRLESRSNSRDFEAVHSGPLCSAEVKSLIPATVYHFQVQALNSAGAGPFGECVSCQTPPSSPGAVSTASIRSIVGASTIALTWGQPDDHGAPILSYSVEIGDNLHATDSPEICIEGLVPESTYKVRIQAMNSVGPGPFSSPLKIVTRGLPPLPPTLECCGFSHNSLRLKWGDGKNPDMKTYTLEMETLQSKRFVPVYQGPSQTFKVTKLQELTAYSFRICASNEEGEGPLSEVCTFTTQRALPPALKAPKVSNIGQTSCCAEWLPSKAIGDDRVSYKLQLATKESDFQVVYSGIQTFFTLNNLLAGTEYSVRVAALRHCSDGELPGPFSPCTTFCTTSIATVETQPPKVFEIVNSWKNREPLTDQQWAVIILCAFTFIAVCVAILIQQILS